MNGGTNPQSQPADPGQAQVEQARRQINRIAEEITQLSEAELAPADYYRELLNRLYNAAQAAAGAIWLRTPQGNLVLQYQVNMREAGLDRHPQARPMHDELLRQAALEGKPAMLAPQSSFGQGDAPELVAGNPTDLLLLVVPIIYDKQVVGLIEMLTDPRRPGSAQQGLLQFLGRMANLAAAFTRNHQLRQMSGQQQLWMQLETFARQVHGSLNPTEVAYLVANDGRRLIEADRISVAVRLSGRKSEVLSISGADVVEKRSNLVQLMRTLFDAVLAWGEQLVYTGTKDEGLPPPVLEALDAYLAESNSQLLVIQPLKDEREEAGKKKPRSALMMECFETTLSAEQLIARLDVVGKHAGPALYNAAEYRRIPLRYLWLPLAYLQDGLGGKTQAIIAAVAVGLAALVLTLLFVRYPLKMEANGPLLPIERRWVFAPVAGQVIDISPRLVAGAWVNRNEDLLRMFDMELAKQLRSLDLEIENQDAIIKSPAPRPGEVSGADARDHAAKVEEARITMRAKREERDKLIARTGANPKNPGEFVVKAPISGRILSADFREALLNKHVKPNEPLLRIGYTDRDSPKLAEWEIELKIPQKHVGQVLAAFNGKPEGTELDVDVLITSRPTEVFRAKLRKDRIARQANTGKDDNNEAEATVLAWARVHGTDIPAAERIPQGLLYVSGTETHTRIRCGNRAMGYSLFYGVWEFTFEKVIFYLWP